MRPRIGALSRALGRSFVACALLVVGCGEAGNEEPCAPRETLRIIGADRLPLDDGTQGDPSVSREVIDVGEGVVELRGLQNEALLIELPSLPPGAKPFVVGEQLLAKVPHDREIFGAYVMLSDEDGLRFEGGHLRRDRSTLARLSLGGELSDSRRCRDSNGLLRARHSVDVEADAYTSVRPPEVSGVTVDGRPLLVVPLIASAIVRENSREPDRRRSFVGSAYLIATDE